MLLSNKLSCKGQYHRTDGGHFGKAAIFVMGKICDGPIAKNLPKGMP